MSTKSRPLQNGGVSFTSGVKVNDDTIPQTGQEKPSIAVNNKGQIFIAWIDKRLGNNWTIYTSFSLNGGEIFSPNVNVNDNLIHREDPDISADDSGRVYVVYEELLPNVRQVAFARSDDTCQSFGFHTYASDVPADGNSCCAIDPSMAINDYGMIGVSWSDSRQDSVTLRFSVSNNFGEAFSPSVRVDDDPDVTDETIPFTSSLACDNGIFYTVWTDAGPDNRNSFSYSSNKGQSFTPSKRVNSFKSGQLLPSLAVNKSEKVFVAWLDDRIDPIFSLNYHTFVAQGTLPVTKGDLNFNGFLDIVDVVLEMNAVFLGQSFPAPSHRADGNCDGNLTPSDMVLLLNRYYRNIPFPCS